MAEKSRTLPAWMSKKEGKRKEKEELKSCQTRKTLRSIFYCMNEKELTEAAASCLAASPDVELISQHKVKDEPSDPQVKRRKTDLSGSDPPKKPVTDTTEEHFSSEQDTYVSQSDLDVTELQTVSYTEIAEHGGAAEGQSSTPIPGDISQKSDACVLEEETKERAEMDDELRLVREIFFS